ncbi:MAG: hypothetical protein Kow0068_21960 [Marinilabiliales bacterium]
MKTPVLIFCLFVFIYYSEAQEYISVHKQQKDFYDNLGFTTTEEYDQYNGFKLMPKTGYKANCNLNRVVFGWHPYWVGSAYLNYQWDCLSDLSFFSYEVDASTGDPVSTHGWETAAIIDSAQAHGVNVNLCVTLFSNHSTFFGSTTAQQNLITNLINLVQLRNAKGVNIDFEGVSSSLSSNLTSFMIDLCNQMHSAIPGSQVSICTYSVDWSGLFDLNTLNNYVDYFTIMGYGYYYSGSSVAGPTAPLYTFQSSYNYNLSKTINYYLSNGASKEKLVLGLPYYGHEWNTTSSTVPSSTTSSVSSRTYKYVKDNSTGNYSNRQWDPNSFTPYYVYNSGNWRQCFVDDEISLAYRYDLVNRRDIAGIGIWALGYDDGYTELWDLIRNKFTDCATVACTDTIYDMGGPYMNYYDDEYYVYTIEPTGATGLSLTFNSFSLEAGYDSLWIYDGPSTSSTLIGGYSGTTSPGTIVASGNSLTLEFYSDGATTESGFEAVYQCTTDNIPPTSSIYADNWETDNFYTTFVDSDNVAVTQKFYQILDWNGTEWRANGEYGFLNDNFETAIHPEWTDSSGTWQILNNHLNQTDEANSNTNLYIDVKQDSGYIYMYHWQMNIGGSGTNRRAGIHFFCDSADQYNRNNSYMVYFRVDQDKCQIYRYDDNVYTLQTDDDCTVLPDTWYDYKVIFNTITGEIKAYQNNILVSQWTDTNPFRHANQVSLRTGNCNVFYDDVKVYKSRDDSALVTIGNSSAEVRYQNPDPATPACRIKSIVTDAAENFSTPAGLDINIDWTPPTDISYVNDGTGADEDTTDINTELSANWSLSTDTNSNIQQYLYAIGSSPGDSDIVNWTSAGLNTYVTHTGLNLPLDTFYFSIKAQNNAGLYSGITTSDGIVVTNSVTPPSAGFNSNTNLVCSGQYIYYTNTSVNADSYQWYFEGGNPQYSYIDNPAILYDTSGTFDVILIAYNSNSSDTLIMNDFITVEQSPVAAFTASPLNGQAPLMVLFTNNSTGANNYTWLFGDGAYSTDFQPYHIYNTNGTYTVMLTASNGVCPDDTYICNDCINVGNTSISSIISQNKDFYPNPVKDNLYIDNNGDIVKIFSPDGKIIYQGNKSVIDLSSFASGLYFIQINNRIEKLVVE